MSDYNVQKKLIGRSSQQVDIVRVEGETSHKKGDLITVEEPLEMRIIRRNDGDYEEEQNIAITMRTPGNDHELVAGFLFTEGFFERPEELIDVRHCDRENNVVIARIDGTNRNQMKRGTDGRGRQLVVSSSCGVCGKASIEAILDSIPEATLKPLCNESSPSITAATLHTLPHKLHRHQQTFMQTGGLHAAALFTPDGKLQLLREDVGRHNALDKLIGRAVFEASLPFSDLVILFSGRTSLELVQKAACAGVRFIAAVGAPSSLARQLAADIGITLVGFLRKGYFNVYTGAHRIPELMNTNKSSDQATSL